MIVYILQSDSDSSFYVGSTSDLEQRILEHNHDSSGYTSRKRPWKLVYSEICANRSSALIREKYIKRMKSRKYIESLIQTGS